MTVLFFPIVILSLPFNKDGRLFHFYLNIWARVNLFTSGVKLEMIGKENILQGRPQIFMANHLSIYDIFALSTLPVPFCWLAKKELFRIPVLGWIMTLIGCVSVDRFDPQKALTGLNAAQTALQKGASILIFPEGTRSPDGRVLPFKRGGFILALKKRIPIVPITIIGSDKIVQKGRLKVHPGKITIIIDRPVETQNVRVRDRKDLLQGVQETVSRNLYKNISGENIPPGV